MEGKNLGSNLLTCKINILQDGSRSHSFSRTYAFIATELHKPFGRYFFSTSDVEKQAAEDAVLRRLDFLAGRLRGNYLFGSEFSVADAYLYVMLRWGRMKRLDLPEPLSAFAERMNTRPAVRLALQHEGLA